MILVLTLVNERHRDLINAAAGDEWVVFASPDSVDPALVRQAQIIFGNPPVQFLEGCSELKWLQLNSAGVGPYANPQVLDGSVILTNASGAYGVGISEYMLGVLLAIFRKLHLYRDQQAAAIWSNVGAVRSIAGSTALIVGLGDIGGEFAKRLKMLGAYTIGIRRTEGAKPDFINELYTLDQFCELLHRADIVSLSLPSTPLTHRLINADTLKMMKSTAVLLNVGRGDCIDSDALCDALEAGHLLGVALDVTDPEPLPPDHRLWKIKNAIITPHVSGGYSLPLTHDKIIDIFIRNLQAYRENKPMHSLVDRQAGY